MADDTDSYYAPQDTGETENTATETSPEKKAPEKKDETAGETALLPKSIFGDQMPEVGDVCHFKVEHVWENEIEVSWVPEGEEEKGEKKGYGKKPGGSTMDEAMGGFDKMVSGEGES